ncbi:MAG: methyltransferase [Kiritimatiellae bacterium]|nr:methyltransferase [Kiritimatiellia bacterium]
MCTPHLPAGPWDEIRFRTGPKLMSGELALDLLQEIAGLSPNAKIWGGDAATPKVYVDFIGRERDRNDLVDKIRDNPGRVRDFSAKWHASVPGGPDVEFTSFPGCFCHRRSDAGGLALAEVVSADLRRRADPAAPVRLLDMGCGCGLVGYLIASAIQNVSLVMVDSHSRAIEAAALNAKNLGFEPQLLLSADGTPPEMDRSFDVFVGNPPYYSDYRIADVFLATAARALKKGGTCYTVVKNDAGLKPVQERWFPSVEVVHRRGYCVLKSTFAA